MNYEVEQLKSQLEDLHLRVLDINESHEQQVTQLNQYLEECRKVRSDQSVALEADLQHLKVNCEYCKNSLKVTESLNAQLEKKSKAAIAQAEHLAYHTIRLQEELSRVKTEFPKLREDNEKLRNDLVALTQASEKANYERDNIRRSLKSVMDSHHNNECLVQALSNENNILKQLNRILVDGLTRVIDCGVFVRRSEARSVLATYQQYVSEQSKLNREVRQAFLDGVGPLEKI